MAQSSSCAPARCVYAHCTHGALAAELNRRISPLFHADKICKPLLIGQGSNDPRVKQAEADQIFEAMKVGQLMSVIRAVCYGSIWSTMLSHCMSVFLSLHAGLVWSLEPYSFCTP